MLKLADTSLILINPSQSNVKRPTYLLLYTDIQKLEWGPCKAQVSIPLENTKKTPFTIGYSIRILKKNHYFCPIFPKGLNDLNSKINVLTCGL